MDLASQSQLGIAMAPQAAGTGNVNGNTIDTRGATNANFTLHVGTVVSGAAASWKIQQGDASDGSDMVDIDGAVQTIQDTDDDKLFEIEIAKLRKRYVRCVVLRATQNVTINGCVVRQTGLRTFPRSLPTGVDQSIVINS